MLVDDGSTDRSSQICDEYAQLDSRIKVIHKKNEGLVKARKEGLQEARGEYIAFVDNDDWIELDMYENMIDSLESSGADFVDTGYFCEKDNSSYIERKLERSIRIRQIYETQSILGITRAGRFYEYQAKYMVKSF